MEWNFRYRAYKKTKTIQLKPYHDNQKHFSIVWSKDKNLIALEDFNIMDTEIRNYIINNNYKLNFRIIKSTTNCTYGRFNAEFENLILKYRKIYNLCTDKDLPLDKPDHGHLKIEELWNEDNPIIFHIHSRDEKDEIWQNLLRNSSKDTILVLNIKLLETE